MTGQRGHDPFLEELIASEGEGSVELLSELFAARVESASSAGRERLLAEVRSEGRLWHFADAVASLLDLSLSRARALLDAIDDPNVWFPTSPTAAFYWVEGGPRLQGASRGFLRIAAGSRTPEHEHVGEEITLVLQGSYVDLATGATHRPGEIVRNPPGSVHTLEVVAGGPDLLQLAIVYGGVRIGGETFGPRD